MCVDEGGARAEPAHEPIRVGDDVLLLADADEYPCPLGSFDAVEQGHEGTRDPLGIVGRDELLPQEP